MELSRDNRQQHNNFEPVVVIAIVASINKLVPMFDLTAPIIPHSQIKSIPVA